MNILEVLQKVDQLVNSVDIYEQLAGKRLLGLALRNIEELKAGLDSTFIDLDYDRGHIRDK